ncbi:MAG: hypothetical protein JOZ77_12965 [Candidatus Eremiobacteraeota bacterium]|nr:hypothetical protein [Candidatus Eremiobacteraeota bacterium]
MRRALTIFIVVAASTVPKAYGATSCTQEILSIQATSVTIGYCVSGPARGNGAQEIIVPVTETYSAPGGMLRRSTELHFIDGEPVSRILENLDLAKVGLRGTLHLTLAYSGGLVRVEGALLTPGAITIK